MNRPTDEQLLAKATAEHAREQANHDAGYRPTMTSIDGEYTVPGVQARIQHWLAQLDRNENLLFRAAHESNWAPPDDVSGLWLLFSGQDYDPAGGWHDFVGLFDTWEDLVVVAQALESEDWLQAVKVENTKLVAEWHAAQIYPVMDEVPRQRVWIRGDEQ